MSEAKTYSHLFEVDNDPVLRDKFASGHADRQLTSDPKGAKQ